MGMDIRNDLSAQNQTQYMPPVNSKTAKTSGSNTENNAKAVNASNTNVVSQKVPSTYEQNQSRMVLEEDINKIIKQIAPDLDVKFRIHDSGQVITTVTNNDTQEIVREFPAEKILDMVHSMCLKLGIVTNRKV